MTVLPADQSPSPPQPSRAPEPPDDQLEDFTDEDLRRAFAPLVEGSSLQSSGIGTDLEPMLRATIRRALAEYTPASKPFQAPGGMDRFVWQMQALFTSRTYDDILFEKTRRFEVEEVFLLDSRTLALVSFASCHPARHASARRVATTVHRLASQVRDERGKIRSQFDLTDHRRAIAIQGRNVVLVATVRGSASALIHSDLDFMLRRVEDQFQEEFQDEGSDLMRPLQPFLEDCLLIQSPAAPE